MSPLISNPQRVARSLVTVLALTLIQTVGAPLIAPKVMAPESKAVTGTFTASSSTSRSYITIPAGVESITLTITGGGGGQGGIDGDKAGGKGGMAQRVVASFAVTPGDVVSLFPGNAGANGIGGANINSGGTGVGGAVAGGASTVTDSYWNINGTNYQNPSFSGGGGGKVGSQGGSGSGGGGGAASVVAINRNIVAIAGGAGGGGGAGNATGAQGTDGVDANTPHSNLMYGGTGKDSGAGLTCSASDGGGGGGGGGGYLAGTGGDSVLVGNECSGRGGYRGNALVYGALSSTVSSFNTSATPTSPLNGTITYAYDVKSPSVCTPTSTIVDIYTVLKFDASINCTWTVPSTVSVIDIFAVGGGGGGGDDGGTGGGGGAGLSRTAVPVTPSSSLTIRVGYGGRGGNFNAWSSDFGETSSVTTIASTFNAPGGQGGGNRATGKGAGGSAAANGTFAGGAGGVYPSQNAIGGAGNYGISNYFFGSLNTYAGGGGGGCYYDLASGVSGPAGRNGGGAGCSNTAASGQTDGVNGTAGTGGGGGGGGAGPAGRVMGGKGGSGVVLIRYATNAVDAFPASVTSALSARWLGTDFQYLDSARRGWMDSSGTNSSTRVLSGSTTRIVDAPAANGSTKTFETLQGATTDEITLADLPANYTLFNVARYNNGSKGRLITTSSGNWLSGFYQGATGTTHHNWWMTPASGVLSNSNNWLLSSDQLRTYRANGRDVTYNQADVVNGQYWFNYVSTSTGFGINNSNYAEKSDWQVADVLVFNRQLSNGETRAIERYLARIYGLTLDPISESGETDTALSLDGNQYFYTQLGFGNTINDTFTIEAWVNPSSQCGAGGGVRCTIFSKEYAVRATIYDGKFGFIMYGTSTVWEWNDTSLKIPINEWHHIALVKRGVANSNSAVEIYLDGQLVLVKAGSPYVLSTANATFNSANILRQNDDQWIYVGAALGDYDRFRGQLDEVKVWKTARTSSEIKQDMHSPDASNPSLQFYWDFNKSVGSKTENISNLGYGGGSRADLLTVGSATYVDVKTTNTTTPYTTITFPRTYITQTGGWTVPSNITTASTIIVGGGGGSGKSASSSSAPGGSGGGGGVTYVPTQGFTPGATITVRVGTGGTAATTQEDDASSRNGFSSYLGVSSGLTALGGGGGGSNGYVGAGGSTIATGGGGGGNPVGSSSCLTRGYAGGVVSTGYNGANGGWGWGGLGGSARGAATAAADDCYGVAGPGFTDPVTNKEYGRAGSNQFYANWSVNVSYSTANNGWGGSVAYGSGAATNGVGFNGSSGVVILRYITALKPAYTKPTNAYLNVGMTETFTTNVAVDSATVGLTRTFRWESTTPTSNGSYTLLKSGTGEANAAYSWVPTDTSTSGSGYLYRLTVTDSDTAGLFITDSSTAFAVINPTLLMSGVTSIKKQINVARNETFTVSAGTPGYRYTLIPSLPGVTLDTSTIGTTLLKISDTASVGTYSLTLTVTDSVSASVSIPIALTISAPPNLVNSAQIIENDLVFNIDMANTASYSRTTGTVSDISGTKKQVTINGGSTFSDDYSGILKLSNTQHISATGFATLPSFTIEAYVSLQSISSGQVCVFSSEQNPTNVAYFMCIDSTRTVFTGFYNGGWTYKRTSQQLSLGSWTHLVGTFDSTTAGTKMELYFNGSVATLSDSAQNAGLVPPTASSDKIFINKWFYTSTAPTSAMDIGFVRLYSAPFDQAKVTQNYNATKDRFATANISQLKPSQKYGTLTLESFTATSGGDTKTITFTTGNRSGIGWDTTTVLNRANLSIQDSLSVGSYYETVTVTDSLGQSTYLPIKMTVTKADTITVSMESATVVTFNGRPITIYPRTTIKGLKSYDTATSLTRFASSLYTETTTVPTNADTYTVRGAIPVFSVGLLSNYEGVIYETTTAVVNKARQRSLDLNLYGGVVGSPFLISLRGGDGTGAVTETLTGVSSLTGCAISNRFLTATEQKQGFCEVRVVKAGDQNYFAETQTAQLYFMAFINNQPTGQVGSGATIGLNGATSLETSTVQPPAITGLSTLSLSLAAGGTFTITGSGFNGSITVKFWRNKIIVTTSGNGTTINIPVSSISSVGATTGRIAVITVDGQAVSADTLTITP